MTKPFVACILALLSAAACGCEGTPPGRAAGAVQSAVDLTRDTDQARHHNREACAMLDRDDLSGAQKEVKLALAADPTFGPAHNTQGVLCYRRKDYYQAAVEYQAAAGFMPKKAEPRNNLGLVLESAGRLEDAAKAFEEALALEPSIETTGNLARVYVRLNRRDDRTTQLLRDVVMKDGRPEWVTWARQRLAMSSAASMPATAPATMD